MRQDYSIQLIAKESAGWQSPKYPPGPNSNVGVDLTGLFAHVVKLSVPARSGTAIRFRKFRKGKVRNIALPLYWVSFTKISHSDQKRGRESFSEASPGPAAGAQRRLQAELLRRFFLQGRFPERCSPCYASPQRRQLPLRLRRVDMLQPVGRHRHRPRAQPRRLLLLAQQRAGPPPLFRTLRQVRPQRIPLDVVPHGQQVFILLDGKCLEAALVQGTRPGGMVVRVPALGVGDGQPAHVFGEVAVGVRPEQQVPVVGHDAEGQQCLGCQASAWRRTLRKAA